VADVFPYCSWWLETTPETMNVAFPDTSATYWTTPYLALPGMSIEVAGTFPETRFLAFTAYNNAGGVYESATGAPSQVTDFDIVPTPGTPEPNPWAVTSAPDTPAGGTFTVTLREGVNPGDVNALPILPPDPQPQGNAPANLGFLVMRVYLPEGGAQDVALPKLTVVDAQGKRTTLPTCNGKGIAALGKIAKAKKFLSIMKQIKAGTWPSPQPPPCATDPGGCPPEKSAATSRRWSGRGTEGRAATQRRSSGSPVVARLSRSASSGSMRSRTARRTEAWGEWNKRRSAASGRVRRRRRASCTSSSSVVAQPLRVSSSAGAAATV
jgi:hypothetical protein